MLSGPNNGNWLGTNVQLCCPFKNSVTENGVARAPKTDLEVANSCRGSHMDKSRLLVWASHTIASDPNVFVSQ